MTRPDLSCAVYVNGEVIADDGPSYVASVPTVLTGLQLVWGRADVVSQPDTTSLSFTVAQNPGRQDLLELLHVGYPVQVYAGGVIPPAPGAARVDNPIQVDGSFETPIANRARVISLNPAMAASLFVGPPRSGMQSLGINPWRQGGPGLSFQTDRVAIPPAPFSPLQSAWDDIPVGHEGEEWTVTLWIRYPFVDPTLSGEGNLGIDWALFSGPAITSVVTYNTGTGITHTLNPIDTTWQQFTATFTIPAGTPQWVGVWIVPRGAYHWQDFTATNRPWTDPIYNVPWDLMSTCLVDDMVISAPATAREEFEVFSGRITDLEVKSRSATAAECVVTCQDITADIANDNVGDEPWNVQTASARIARIRQLSTIAWDIDITAAFAAMQLSYVDVDSQPVLSLLQDIANSVDAVLWAAFHLTRGFYFWFEDPVARESLGALVWDPAQSLVVVDWTRWHPSDAVVVSACKVPREAPSFVASVADVLTRVDATWQEQTVDDSGVPAPTERYVHVYDPAGQAQYGIRTASVTTQLISATDCTNVATRILIRSEGLHWRAVSVEWDSALRGAYSASDVEFLSRILDGASRIGLPVTLTDLPEWAPAQPATNAYLEGGTYTYERGYWSVALTLSPSQTLADSAIWTELLPGWRWVDFDPEITWSALWGVGVSTLTATRHAQDVAARIIPRPIPPLESVA